MDFIKECFAQLKMRLRLDSAIIEKLEEHDGRLYRLEEDNKRLQARNKVQDEEIAKLRLTLTSMNRRPEPR